MQILFNASYCNYDFPLTCMADTSDVYCYPFVFLSTSKDAIKEQSWWTPLTITKGDVEAGFRSSEHVLEGEMHVGGQEHFYLETHAHLAVPKGEDGGMEVYSATQNAAGTQRHVAAVLGVPLNLVTCRVKRLGGAFGGKETRNIMLSVPISVAAAA